MKMTIEEYCQRILFGTKLQDKLLAADVELQSYQSLTQLPALPGRPQELAFDLQGSMALPSVHQLEDIKSRGLLLHFFLNHELLALEIMALVLLKFPNLPDSFKRTLLKTMEDEQRHASLYIQSMKEFDVVPGEMPVNSFFWDCFKDINDPLDFITGMSLTFEQANLDFSLYYKEAFETVGDSKTAAVLNEVYVDEISHVSNGLKWFRRWKKKGVSDWQFYVDSLKLPLSPGRAKGRLFDREGRLKAGFDEDFIEHLNVSSFSRGRAPDVYLFHAFVEPCIVLGKSFNTPKWGVALEEDLSLVPLPFAGKDDILLTCARHSVKHLHKLQQCGFELPQIIEKELNSVAKPLKDRHPGKMQPWGWSPKMDQILADLQSQQKVQQCGWQDSYKAVFSKVWAVGLLKILTEKGHSWFQGDDVQPVVCQSLGEIKEAFKISLQAGHRTLAVKSPFGASGRDIMRFPNGEFEANQEGRLKNLLKKQGSLIVEPWVERTADFSAHFQRDGKVKFLGISRLINDHHGQYSGSLFGKPFQGLGPDAMKLLQQGGPKGIHSFYEGMVPLLEEILIDCDYRGPFGIDLFIFKNPAGELRVRPVVEVNFRYTMGRLALQLEKKLAAGKTGLFKIFSLLSSREREFAEKLVQYKETLLQLNEKGKWIGGCCQLNEWHSEIKFAVYISVASNMKECLNQLGINVEDEG